MKIGLCYPADPGLVKLLHEASKGSGNCVRKGQRHKDTHSLTVVFTLCRNGWLVRTSTQ